MPAVRKLANSVRLALPRITAPALRRGAPRAAASAPGAGAAAPGTPPAAEAGSSWRRVKDIGGPPLLVSPAPPHGGPAHQSDLRPATSLRLARRQRERASTPEPSAADA